eukprot:comp23048_c0_seq1/m.36890 comp23048_c0_seq1/g.36890  ORF comp23048_c0_seq1/g.36890 comp23048_c0_seq1/m.36890 type:complete len:580 (-) comp23048_c0_seq1:321-2060(-)
MQITMKPNSPVLGRARANLHSAGVQGGFCMRGFRALLIAVISAAALFVLVSTDTQTSVYINLNQLFRDSVRPKSDVRRHLKLSSMADEAYTLQESIAATQRQYAEYMGAHRYGVELPAATYARVSSGLSSKPRQAYTKRALAQPHTRQCRAHEYGMVPAPADAPSGRSFCFGGANIRGLRVCDSPTPKYLEIATQGTNSDVYETRVLYNKTFAFRPFFFKGDDWKNPNLAALKKGNAIAVASQGTFNRIQHLVRLTQLWKGPVSFALLVDSQQQAQDVLGVIAAQPVLKKHLAIHLVWRLDHTSSDADAFYPINMLRNMAQQPISLPWVFVLDVDVTPSAPMTTYVAHTLRAASSHGVNRDCPGLEAYVPPAVEMGAERLAQMYQRAQSSDTLSKDLLVEAFLEGKAKPMHLYFSPAYVPTNHYAWVLSDTVDPLPYVSRFEPYYVARTPLPLFNETFVNRGGNYAQQVLEMHVGGYRFWRLPELFVVDIPHQAPAKEADSKPKAKKGGVVDNVTKQLAHQEDFVVARWNDLLDWLPHRYGVHVPKPFDTAFRRYRRTQQRQAETLWALITKMGRALDA